MGHGQAASSLTVSLFQKGRHADLPSCTMMRYSAWLYSPLPKTTLIEPSAHLSSLTSTKSSHTHHTARIFSCEPARDAKDPSAPPSSSLHRNERHAHKRSLDLLASGRAIHALKGYRWGGTSVAIRGDCTRIVSRGNDGTVRVWDAESGLEKLILKESAGRVTSVAIRSDSTRIVSRGYDG